jgi:hypothetical protein
MGPDDTDLFVMSATEVMTESGVRTPPHGREARIGHVTPTR